MGKGSSFCVSLTAGRHRLRCVNRKLHLLYNFPVTVEASQVYSYKKQLQPGTLVVHANPYGRIFLQGLGLLGYTQRPYILYEGTYRLILYKQEKLTQPQRYTVRIRPHQQKTLRVFWKK